MSRMTRRSVLLGLPAVTAAGVAAAAAQAAEVAAAEVDGFPLATWVTATGRVSATFKRNAHVDVGQEKLIYVSPMTQALRDLDLKVGDTVEVTWEELRYDGEEQIFQAYEVRLV